MLEATFAGWGFDLQVRKYNSVVPHSWAALTRNRRLLVFTLLRACPVFRNTSHEGTGVILVFLGCDTCALHSFDLVVQLLHKLQLVVGNLVLLLKFIVLKLKPANSDLEEFVLAFRLHGAVLVEFVLRLLVFVFLLPGLDLIPEFLFGFLKLLSLAA